MVLTVLMVLLGASSFLIADHSAYAGAIVLLSLLWKLYFPDDPASQEDMVRESGSLISEKQFLSGLYCTARVSSSTKNEHLQLHPTLPPEITENQSSSETEQDCPLCWDSPTGPVRLKCSHVVCSSCLITYLTTSSSYKNCCPVCKTVLFRPRFWTEDRKHRTAHKLRICAAMTLVALAICRLLLCLYIRYPNFNLEVSFYCTFPGSPADYLESVFFFMVAVYMTWSAKVSFAEFGGEWWRFHRGGFFNYVSALGTVQLCWYRVRGLEPLLAMALRKR